MRLVLLLLVFTILVSCDTPPAPVPAPSPVPPTPTNSLAACKVTIPNGSVPPNVPGADPIKAPCPACHGNGTLWVMLTPDSQIAVTPDRAGALAAKFMWWRGPGITDDLTIGGRRLDLPAAPLRAIIPHGYEGGGFQSSMIIFPTTGCWEITGKAGIASLTFVVQVVKDTAEPAPGSRLPGLAAAGILRTGTPIPNRTPATHTEDRNGTGTLLVATAPAPHQRRQRRRAPRDLAGAFL